MKKVTYIISDLPKALAFEWIIAAIDRNKIELSFILLNSDNTPLEDYIRSKRLQVYRVPCPSTKNIPLSILRVYKLLRKIKPAAVHCHLIKANIVGLSAAWLAKVPKRIYTRHHSSLHHIYFKKGILWDKMANKLATDVIAISGIVKKIIISWEGADPQKVHLIHHGFELQEFEKVASERIVAFRKRHSIQEGKFVVGVISRFTEWKGVQYIIPAFQSFLQIEKDAILVLLNASGDYASEVQRQLDKIPQESYRLVSFEQDIAAAYKTMNCFVHVPIDEHSEAFGQVYIEALAAGVPSIFTLSGIAADFIQNEKNALVVPFRDSQTILNALLKISGDVQIAHKLSAEGNKSVQLEYSLESMIRKLEAIYN